MLIALAQLNQTVGDLEGNAARIVEAVEQATAAGARLVITSELSLLGYPARDLLLDRAWIGRSWRLLDELAQRLTNQAPVLVGLAEPNDDPQGRPLFNCAALVQTGALNKLGWAVFLPSVLGWGAAVVLTLAIVVAWAVAATWNEDARLVTAID